jgi:hypothetical protein
MERDWQFQTQVDPKCSSSRRSRQAAKTLDVHTTGGKQQIRRRPGSGDHDRGDNLPATTTRQCANERIEAHLRCLKTAGTASRTRRRRGGRRRPAPPPWPPEPCRPLPLASSSRSAAPFPPHRRSGSPRASSACARRCRTPTSCAAAGARRRGAARGGRRRRRRGSTGIGAGSTALRSRRGGRGPRGGSRLASGAQRRLPCRARVRARATPWAERSGLVAASTGAGDSAGWARCVREWDGAGRSQGGRWGRKLGRTTW